MTKQLLSVCLLALGTLSGQEITKFSFAAIGDVPYLPTTPDGTRQVYPSPSFERVIAAINADRKVDFTIHIGDIKGGNTRCEDEVYSNVRDYFNSFRRPLFFAAGDNEWTDCHRDTNGTFDPLERLSFLRKTFFPDAMSLGARKMQAKRQGDDPAYSAYVENMMWTVGPVVFVTLNQPGSNNNRGRISGEFLDLQDREYTARNQANMAWLDAAFAAAAADKNNRGVVIAAQSNPFERFLEVITPPYATSGYADFIAKVRDFAQKSGKQVLYIGGDTHYFRIDHPLTTLYPAAGQASNTAGTRLQNFTRLEVFGQTEIHWVRVNVDLANRDLFDFQTVTVSGN